MTAVSFIIQPLYAVFANQCFPHPSGHGPFALEQGCVVEKSGGLLAAHTGHSEKYEAGVEHIAPITLAALGNKLVPIEEQPECLIKPTTARDFQHKTSCTFI